MLECWQASPDQRPCFGSLTSKLESLLQTSATYLQLDFDQQNPGYYRGMEDPDTMKYPGLVIPDTENDSGLDTSKYICLDPASPVANIVNNRGYSQEQELLESRWGKVATVAVNIKFILQV